MNTLASGTPEIEAKVKAIESQLGEHVADRGRLALVQAPPGSGKTSLLLKTVEQIYGIGRRVAIATQTNAQADDICRRFAVVHPKVPVFRYASGQSAPTDLGKSITWTSDSGALPAGKCVVVATTAKWSLVTIPAAYDVVFVEEAWQMGWADFMLLGQVSERFVLIGDPGQIPPVVSVDVARWETSPRPPHIAAPRVILEDAGQRPEQWQLPATRRLPSDAAGLVRPFYDFEFGATAKAGERAVLTTAGGKSAEDRLIDSLAHGSVAALTLPTHDEGPPLHSDQELAAHAAKIVQRLLRRDAKVRIGGKSIALTPDLIGMCATHRVMNSALALALPGSLQGKIMVDTPERWQGLERPVMILIHPLSGVVRPSSFDLSTGRLCVMASRHLAGAVILSRDHVTETLANTIPSATQPVGRPDVSGRGLFDNLSFWSTLKDGGRVVSTC